MDFSSVRAYNKTYLSKTMGIAVVGMAFRYDLGNSVQENKLLLKELKVTKLDRESLLVRTVLLLKINYIYIMLIIV